MKSKSSRAAELASSVAHDCIGARVRMLNRMVTRVYDDALRPHGVRFSQMNILTVVACKGPVQPSEVAEILAIEKSTLSRNVRLMESNGWIESLPGERGHSQLLRTTSSGERLYRRVFPDWEKAQKQIIKSLGEPAADAICAAAKRARDAK